jgi:AraC-like DNA-binding protein
MAFVRTILLAYENYGVDPHELLRRAHLSPAAVRRLDGRIDAEQMETIAATAMQQLDDEALGWFARRLPWGTYGMLCRASLGAPSLRVALKLWCRHHRLLVDDVVLSLHVEGGRAHVEVEERRELGAMRELCLLTLLRYVHGYACWWLDSELPLVEVAFPFPPPRHERVYPLSFPGPVRFGAKRAGFAFDARYLELPPKRDERALRLMLQRALPLTVRQYRRDRLLVERVRTWLASPEARGATAEALAAAMHVSVRTLHRQLASEGASLQAIKDDVRRRHALELLRRTSRPVKQIAAEIGFRNEKSFSRAFHAWTGESPSDHRRHAAAHDEPRGDD